MSLFINAQVMACRSPDDDDFWSLDDDFRYELLAVADELEGNPVELNLTNDAIRMYCGL